MPETPDPGTTKTDVWVGSGDEGLIRATSEGAQSLQQRDAESPEQLAYERGITVLDDEIRAEETSDDDTMIVNMGPQHPSTHGVLRLQLELQGEIVRRVKPVIGYLHTGMEKTAEDLTYTQGPTNVTRMDYLSNMHEEWCFCLAAERLLGIEAPPRAQMIRVLMTELNRVSSHCVALATSALDIGAISMMLYGNRERERCLRFFEKVTGLRMNNAYIRVGGVAADLPDGWEDDVLVLCDQIIDGLGEYSDLLLDQPIWRARTVGVGVITVEEALAWGVTGPNLRATGFDWDLRRDMPYDGFATFDLKWGVVTGTNGDVYDRYLCRLMEMEQSVRIARQCVEMMPAGDFRIQDRKVTPPPRARIDESMEALIHHFKLFTEGVRVPAGEVYQVVESARGELGMYMVSDGSARPWRLHVRGPSFANVGALPVMMADTPVADAVATIASTDPVLGDVDR